MTAHVIPKPPTVAAINLETSLLQSDAFETLASEVLSCVMAVCRLDITNSRCLDRQGSERVIYLLWALI